MRSSWGRFVRCLSGLASVSARRGTIRPAIRIKAAVSVDLRSSLRSAASIIGTLRGVGGGGVGGLNAQT